MVLCIINWLISILLIGSSRVFVRQIYWGIRDGILQGSDLRKNILIFLNLYKRFQPVFDLIFIDGGHSYEVVKQDLENSKKLSHSETIVVMDDTYRSQTGSMEWNEGPNKAWSENIERGHLVEIGSRDYLPGRGMSWGFFH